MSDDTVLRNRGAQPSEAFVDEGLRSTCCGSTTTWAWPCPYRDCGLVVGLDAGDLPADLRHAAEVGGDAGAARLHLLLLVPIHAMSAATAQTLFWAFCALMGLSLASVFLVFTGTSIARTFFIAAAMFGATSLSATRRSATSRPWAPSCSWA